MSYLKTTFWMSALLFVLVGCAGMKEGGVEQTAVTPDVREAIKTRLEGLGQEVAAIEPSPVVGWYSVDLGGESVYISGDGRYFVRGQIVDLDTREPIDEPRKQAARRDALSTMDVSSMVVYPAVTGPAKYALTVFTDVDCPYCRRFHRKVPALNELGVEVRYVFLPLQSLHPDAYRKSVQVWCAEDRRAAMDAAKQGDEPVAAREDCVAPVDDHLAVAKRLGINGTPTGVSPGGRIVPLASDAGAIVAFLAEETR